MSYRILYNVSARGVLLVSNNISVADAENLVDEATDSFEFNVTDAMYFVEGVTVILTVVAVNGSTEGQSAMATAVASGGELWPRANLSLSLSFSVSLTLSSLSLSSLSSHPLPHLLFDLPFSGAFISLLCSICSSC